MTQHILPASLSTRSGRAPIARPGIEQGWPRGPKRSLTLWRWSPRGLEHRGRTPGRDLERAYRDMQVAADVASWREGRIRS